MEDEIMTESNSNQEMNPKQWLQDNLRIIISILIVVVIAGGIYSYSNRGGQASNDDHEVAQTEESSEETTTPLAVEVTESDSTNDNTQVASSQETENSFIQTAGKGDGLTHLARRAVANYLEKNQDSTLTAEHKIYIEDYLRKNVGNTGSVHIGTSVEFSNSLIQDAITKSKTLNEKQLTNLHKYVVRVSSLS